MGTQNISTVNSISESHFESPNATSIILQTTCSLSSDRITSGGRRGSAAYKNSPTPPQPMCRQCITATGKQCRGKVRTLTTRDMFLCSAPHCDTACRRLCVVCTSYMRDQAFWWMDDCTGSIGKVLLPHVAYVDCF